VERFSFSLWQVFRIDAHYQLLLRWMVMAAVAVFAFFVAAADINQFPKKLFRAT
jgi:hypothetical protein|tara:strand:- start:88 stop:249 length:162 start_codon:yes stop_codon:yes gene_type:complete